MLGVILVYLLLPVQVLNQDTNDAGSLVTARARIAYNASMFLSMVQAASQLARQIAPNMYVTVQQPLPGMPEWVKILISAGTGALLGIASNIAMEYLKPWIAERATSKQLKEELTEELTDNLDLMQSFMSYLVKTKDDPEVEDSDIFARATAICLDVSRDRYDYFYSEKKIALHNMPGKKPLIKFYGSINSLLRYAETQSYKGELISTDSARLSGQLFLKENGVAYVHTPTAYDKMDDLVASGFDFKHARARKAAKPE